MRKDLDPITEAEAVCLQCSALLARPWDRTNRDQEIVTIGQVGFHNDVSPCTSEGLSRVHKFVKQKLELDELHLRRRL